MSERFTGFTPEAIDFLWGIRMNNNRDWFTQHKKDYVQHLYEPMKALGQTLFQPFAEKGNMVLKVSRIYRDARMHPPEPYKESLWICIRKDVDWWAEHPCLLFEIRPDGASYGFLDWQPGTARMEAFRRQIAAEPSVFLDMIQATEASTGMRVSADCYKRPKPTEDSRLTPYFAWKGGISCIRNLEPGPELYDPNLADQVAELLGKLTPLYDYFVKIGNL